MNYYNSSHILNWYLYIFLYWSMVATGRVLISYIFSFSSYSFPSTSRIVYFLCQFVEFFSCSGADEVDFRRISLVLQFSPEVFQWSLSALRRRRTSWLRRRVTRFSRRRPRVVWLPPQRVCRFWHRSPSFSRLVRTKPTQCVYRDDSENFWNQWKKKRGTLNMRILCAF